MSAQAQPAPERHSAALFAGQMAVKLVLAVATLLVLLSLISVHSDDMQVLSGGIGDYQVIHNWTGRFGAWVSGQLLDWIGLTAYPATVLVLICLVNRAFNRRAKAVNAIYFVGIGIAILGCAMLLGIFPDFLSSLQAKLNLVQTPGGAFGQRFCAPGTDLTPAGWLSYVVNPVGSCIISGAMVVLGLTTIWYFDWHDYDVAWAKAVWADWREKRGEQKADEAVRREQEEAAMEQQIRKQLTEHVEVPRPAPPPPAPRPSPAPAAAPARAVKAQVSGTGSIKKAAPKQAVPYQLPTVEILDPVPKGTAIDPREVEAKKSVLQETLDSFGIDGKVGEATSGPRVTLLEIKPAPGVRVERISSLANNIAMNLKAESLRILTPIPGKDTVGIEVPNRTSSMVSLRELIESAAFRSDKNAIPICLGRDISGRSVIMDLARAPHLLIAGATGSGKSVCMNSLIMSLLYRFSPEQLKLIMVDPKVVEFSGYNSLPHLVTPVISDVKKVPIALRWVLNQMEWRYQILGKVGARNIFSYNSRQIPDQPVLDDDGQPVPDFLPYLVVIIDELADIMMTAKGDVETGLARIAQLARAVGIHAVVATQRPSVNIITGVIKANFPTRIAFQVSSLVDSRTILDSKGAEALLGRGDMLYRPPGGSRLERVQGALVQDSEITRVVDFVSNQAEPVFAEDIFKTAAAGEDREDDDSGPAPAPAPRSSSSAARAAAAPSRGTSEADSEDEALVKRAIEVIMRDRRATVSHLQRRLRVGYNKASLIMEELEERGIVGPQIGQNAREILIVDAPTSVDDDNDEDEEETDEEEES